MRLMQVASAVALLAGSASALATTFNIGVLPLAPAVYFNNVSVPAGAFTDTYSFIFPSLGVQASASAVSIQLTGLLDIGNLKIELFDSSSMLVVGGTVGTSSALSNVPLVGGSSYFYKVTGTATGSVGGAYSFLASASPVPEPGTYAMVLSGIGVIGFLAMRRRGLH